MSSNINVLHVYIWLLSFYRNNIFAIRLPYEFAENIEDEYRLPDLPYDYKELEPYIDEATVRVHHTGHHAAYTAKMNKALMQWRKRSPEDDLLKKNLLEILANIEDVPEEYRKQIRNNAGGQPEDGGLVVSTTANQDSPLSQGLHPILVLDVWEHAYYLKHQNKRNKHVSDWWKLVDWNAVEEIDKWWKQLYAQSVHDEF